jgi:hypothetical protein
MKGGKFNYKFIYKFLICYNRNTTKKNKLWIKFVANSSNITIDL